MTPKAFVRADQKASQTIRRPPTRSSPKPKAYIIGSGPGDAALVAPRAREAVSRCRAVLAWELNLGPLRSRLKGKTIFLQDVANYVEKTQEALNAARQGLSPLAIVRLGDPTVSGGLKGTLAMMPDFAVEVVPGIGAAQVAACRLGIELHRAVLISFHDDDQRNEKEKAFMMQAWEAGRHLILFSGPSMMPPTSGRFLLARGVPAETDCWVGESLTFPNERTWKGRLGELVKREVSWLSITVVANPAEGGLPLS